ncbi:MAG: NAD(P)/FAD-dependent oxidoreductase [Lewinellaceae bacterium]|nr:NAD(P)/FAD-dependent oxidoreductase [Lewinellaceae bacterium]
MLPRRDFIKQTCMALTGMALPLPLINSSVQSSMKDDTQYDVIIIGGSYAGLAAAMALGRSLRKVLVIDGGEPCNRQTPHSHNFLTNDGKPPAAIARLAKQQVQQYDSVSFLDGRATTAIKTGDGFKVAVQSGQTFLAKKLVFATGIKDVLPNIPGLAASWGISVLHCPYCHGYEVRQQKTGILANGDSGYEFAALIANWTNDLTLFTNGKTTLSRPQTAALEKHNINIVEHKIERLDHKKGRLQQIVFNDGSTAAVQALYARVPFIQHTDIPESMGCALTTEGYIKVDAAQKTTVPGVFACGDNASRMRTVANAVATGTTTGIMVNKELIEETF